MSGHPVQLTVSVKFDENLPFTELYQLGAHLCPVGDGSSTSVRCDSDQSEAIHSLLTGGASETSQEGSGASQEGSGEEEEASDNDSGSVAGEGGEG